MAPRCARGCTRGDPIRRADIVKPGDREFLQIVLSPGTRAISIPVHLMGPNGPNTRFLGPFPGDRVDVILTQKFQQDLPLTRRSVGEAIVEDLRVLAIAPPDSKANTNADTTIPMTLEVTPEQAEKITVATRARQARSDPARVWRQPGRHRRELDAGPRQGERGKADLGR